MAIGLFKKLLWTLLIAPCIHTPAPTQVRHWPMNATIDGSFFGPDASFNFLSAGRVAVRVTWDEKSKRYIIKDEQ